MPKNTKTSPNQDRTGLIFAGLGAVIVILGTAGYIVNQQRTVQPVNPNTVADASSPVPQADEEPLEEGWVRVDRSQIERVDMRDEGAIPVHLDDEEEEKFASSEMMLTGAVHYQDWWQSWESHLPLFGEEIDDMPGAQAIRDYYRLVKLPAQADEMEEYLDSFAADGKLHDWEPSKEAYHYGSFSAARQGQYLTVTYVDESFAGGAHPSHLITTDNFDADGNLVTIRDLFASQEDYQTLIRAAIDKWQKENDIESDMFLPTHFTGSLSDELPFQFTPTGVNFIFNEYEIAPYSSGPIDLEIPYRELQVTLHGTKSKATVATPAASTEPAQLDNTLE